MNMICLVTSSAGTLRDTYRVTVMFRVRVRVAHCTTPTVQHASQESLKRRHAPSPIPYYAIPCQRVAGITADRRRVQA